MKHRPCNARSVGRAWDLAWRLGGQVADFHNKRTRCLWKSRHWFLSSNWRPSRR